MSRQLTEFFTPTSQGQGKGRSVEQSEQWQRLSVRFATLYGCGSWHPETVAALTSEIAVTKTEVVTELGTSREAPKGDTGTRSEQVLLHRPHLSGTDSELPKRFRGFRPHPRQSLGRTRRGGAPCAALRASRWYPSLAARTHLHTLERFLWCRVQSVPWGLVPCPCPLRRQR